MTSDRQRLGWIVLGVLALGLVVIALLGLRRPPQMGTSDDVFAAVDALYTAVRNQDEAQVTRCEQRFAQQRQAGKLPTDAAEYLAGVIAQARGGAWAAATRRLYDFMLAQRREGALEPKPTKKKKG